MIGLPLWDTVSMNSWHDKHVVLPYKNLSYYTVTLDNSYLPTMATFFCPQGGLCGEVNNKIYFIDNINSKLASKRHAMTGSDNV